MNDVIHEMEVDRHGSGNGCVGAEFRQRECRVEDVVGGEGVQHVGGGFGVGASGIGGHGVGHGCRLPRGEVGSPAAGGRCESVVLHRHVGE